MGLGLGVGVRVRVGLGLGVGYLKKFSSPSDMLLTRSCIILPP